MAAVLLGTASITIYGNAEVSNCYHCQIFLHVYILSVEATSVIQEVNGIVCECRYGFVTLQGRPEIIMPQTFALIPFLNSFKILLLFPNPLLLFSHYSQQMKVKI